jgi:elongation factor P
MPAANDIRRGQVIKFNGEPHLVMETQHRTPGNLRAFVQIKMRNLRYGKALDQRFASTDTIEVMPTDRKTLEFSYADRDAFAFMDPETFEQIELTATQLGDVKNYLAPGGKVDVLFVDDRPLSVDLPSTVALKIIESADGVKGDTANNVQKPAKLETPGQEEEFSDRSCHRRGPCHSGSARRDTASWSEGGPRSDRGDRARGAGCRRSPRSLLPPGAGA